MKKKILWLSALFLGFFPFASQALIISSPVIELQAEPGQQVIKKVRLENDSPDQVTFYSALNNFTASGTDGRAALTPAPSGGEVDLASWIEVEKGPITLSPKESREMEIKINVPLSADPGGHYAAVLWSSRSPEDKTNNVNIGWQLGHLVLLKVSGEIKEEGKLVNFSLKDKKKVFSRLPLEFNTEFKNSGNVHLKPAGQIEIKNLLGKSVDQITFNAKGGNVLPDSSRIFSDIWTRDGDNNITGGFLTELRAERDNFAFGRYQANLSLIYGTDQRNVNQALVFWVFPWRLILVYTFSFAVIILIACLLMKRYNKWIIKKAQVSKK